MRIEQFQRIFWRVANVAMARYYLGSFPGFMVIEIAQPDGTDISDLCCDLVAHGFTEMEPVPANGFTSRRFIVVRESEN